MDEIWKDIPEYEGIYQVSNLGRVKSFKNGKEKFLKLQKDKKGYLYITLYINKICKKFKVYRLVLLTFKPELYFEKAQVNHIDGNKSNNNLDNLEWCDQSHNMKHAFNNCLINKQNMGSNGEKNGRSKLNEIQVKKIRMDYKNKCFNQSELAKIFNVSRFVIYSIINNKTWSHI